MGTRFKYSNYWRAVQIKFHKLNWTWLVIIGGNVVAVGGSSVIGWGKTRDSPPLVELRIKYRSPWRAHFIILPREKVCWFSLYLSKFICRFTLLQRMEFFGFSKVLPNSPKRARGQIQVRISTGRERFTLFNVICPTNKPLHSNYVMHLTVLHGFFPQIIFGPMFSGKRWDICSWTCKQHELVK